MEARVITSEVLSMSRQEGCEPGSKVTNEWQRMTKRIVSVWNKKRSAYFQVWWHELQREEKQLESYNAEQGHLCHSNTQSMKEKATGKRNLRKEPDFNYGENVKGIFQRVNENTIYMHTLCVWFQRVPWKGSILRTSN